MKYDLSKGRSIKMHIIYMSLFLDNRSKLFTTGDMMLHSWDQVLTEVKEMSEKGHAFSIVRRKKGVQCFPLCLN